MLGLSTLAAQDAPQLTRLQKEQLQVYRQISLLVRQGKTDQKMFFKEYYKYVAVSNKQLELLNRQEAEKLKARAERVLNENKREMAQRLFAGAKMYYAMAEVNKAICEAYDKGSVGDMKKQLAAYMEVEAQMVQNGAKPFPREWFTTREAEMVIKQLAQKK
jgi:hypothetical protein